LTQDLRTLAILKKHHWHNESTVPEAEIEKNINVLFLRKFFTKYPIIQTGHRHDAIIDGKTVQHILPYVRKNPEMNERDIYHNGDFADALAVDADKPMESFSAERFDYLLDCALRNDDKWMDNHDLENQLKEYTPKYSAQDIAHCINALRKACGKDTSIKVHITPDGMSATNIMRRTAYVYHNEAVNKILHDPENKTVIENAGFSSNAKSFIHQSATKLVNAKENPALYKIIADQLYRSKGHGKTTHVLYDALGLKRVNVLVESQNQGVQTEFGLS
jgi:hypothetical protein